MERIEKLNNLLKQVQEISVECQALTLLRSCSDNYPQYVAKYHHLIETNHHEIILAGFPDHKEEAISLEDFVEIAKYYEFYLYLIFAEKLTEHECSLLDYPQDITGRRKRWGHQFDNPKTHIYTLTIC